MDPHVELVMALASGAAWLMTQAGLAKNTLELSGGEAVPVLRAARPLQLHVDR